MAMVGFKLPRYTREYRRKFGGRDWESRLRTLASFAVDYCDKTILDAGCNLGIIGYEICKQHPAFYHGIDVDRAALNVARGIFSGVSVPYAFHRVDVANDRHLRSILRPEYDIVLLLNVLQYVTVHASGILLETLSCRCKTTFIVTGSTVLHFDLINGLHDFQLVRECGPEAPSRSTYFHLARGQPDQSAEPVRRLRNP
jgi:2-polyprenyl-3-methyl-5-hydroxy-6-metoxy-1,4-benzoquinol methylase